MPMYPYPTNVTGFASLFMYINDVASSGLVNFGLVISIAFACVLFFSMGSNVKQAFLAASFGGLLISSLFGAMGVVTTLVPLGFLAGVCIGFIWVKTSADD